MEVLFMKFKANITFFFFFNKTQSCVSQVVLVVKNQPANFQEM